MNDENMVLVTGLRLLEILKFLSGNMATKAEIQEHFSSKYPFIKSFSAETLKLDINTLKHKGYKIKRKYIDNKRYIRLLNKPRFFNLIESECKLLNMAKFAAFELLEPEELLELKKLYESISKFFPENIKNEVMDFRMFDFINPGIYEHINEAIKENKKVIITYNSPSGTLKQFGVFPLKIVIRNLKLYLTCYAHDYKGTAIFRMDNIIGIEDSRIKSGTKPKFKNKNKIKYIVRRSYFDNNPLERFETPVKINTDTVEIEANDEDMFFVMQRILILGENCVKIMDKKAKKLVMKSLKETLENYKTCL